MTVLVLPPAAVLTALSLLSFSPVSPAVMKPSSTVDDSPDAGPAILAPRTAAFVHAAHQAGGGNGKKNSAGARKAQSRKPHHFHDCLFQSAEFQCTS